MSLEKIDKYLTPKKTLEAKSKALNNIKKSILDKFGVEVNIRLKPPSTMILICGSASACSELSSQKDQVLELINNILIYQKITNLIIKQN